MRLIESTFHQRVEGPNSSRRMGTPLAKANAVPMPSPPFDFGIIRRCDSKWTCESIRNSIGKPAKSHELCQFRFVWGDMVKSGT